MNVTKYYMTDPKVLKLCSDLNLSTKPKAFESPRYYSSIEGYLTKYSASTAEDYIWRLCRHLEPHNLVMYDRYNLLLEMYKKKYPNK
jgi:hypothetical protein